MQVSNKKKEIWIFWYSSYLLDSCLVVQSIAGCFSTVQPSVPLGLFGTIAFTRAFTSSSGLS